MFPRYISLISNLVWVNEMSIFFSSLSSFSLSLGLFFKVKWTIRYCPKFYQLGEFLFPILFWGQTWVGCNAAITHTGLVQYIFRHKSCSHLFCLTYYIGGGDGDGVEQFQRLTFFTSYNNILILCKDSAICCIYALHTYNPTGELCRSSGTACDYINPQARCYLSLHLTSLSSLLLVCFCSIWAL